MPDKYPRKVTYIRAEIRSIMPKINDGLWSELVAVMLRTTRLNPSDADRELASRELDLLIEKMTR